MTRRGVCSKRIYTVCNNAGAFLRNIARSVLVCYIYAQRVYLRYRVTQSSHAAAAFLRLGELQF